MGILDKFQYRNKTVITIRLLSDYNISDHVLFNIFQLLCFILVFLFVHLPILSNWVVGGPFGVIPLISHLWAVGPPTYR